MALLVVAATGLELCAALELQAADQPLAPQGEVRELFAHGRALLTLVTGIGVVNSALALGRALGQSAGRALPQRQVSGVLSLGVAGSFDLAAHPLGAVRLVEQEIWPEYGLLPSGAVAADARGLGFALNGRAAGDAAAIFQRLGWDAPGEARRLGLDPEGLGCASSLTVSGVTADAERARRLFLRFGAGLENMEGFALAYAARLAETPFSELRAVSNAVGSRPPEAWDLPGALAALGRATRRLLAPAPEDPMAPAEPQTSGCTTA